MKLTKPQLKKIIQEEIQILLKEEFPPISQGEERPWWSFPTGHPHHSVSGEDPSSIDLPAKKYIPTPSVAGPESADGAKGRFEDILRSAAAKEARRKVVEELIAGGLDRETAETMADLSATPKPGPVSTPKAGARAARPAAAPSAQTGPVHPSGRPVSEPGIVQGKLHRVRPKKFRDPNLFD